MHPGIARPAMADTIAGGDRGARHRRQGQAALPVRHRRPGQQFFRKLRARRPDRHRTNRPGLLVWLGAMLAVTLLRGFDVLIYFPRYRTGNCGTRDIVRCNVVVLLTAAVWGSFPLAFFPMLDTDGLCAAMVIMTALAGGAMTTLAAAWWPASATAFFCWRRWRSCCVTPPCGRNTSAPF